MTYLYIMKCKGDTFYIGITTNLTRRFREHKVGKGGHYTKYNRPQEIVYSEECDTEEIAKKREAQIKRWSKAKKMALIQGNFETLGTLSKSREHL